MVRKIDTEHTTVPPRASMPIVETVPMRESPEPVDVKSKVKAHSSNTMPCPVPGHNGMAEVFHAPGRTYAVCHCPGKTKHYGQVVWEQT